MKDIGNFIEIKKTLWHVSKNIDEMRHKKEFATRLEKSSIEIFLEFERHEGKDYAVE